MRFETNGMAAAFRSVETAAVAVGEQVGEPVGDVMIDVEALINREGMAGIMWRAGHRR